MIGAVQNLIQAIHDKHPQIAIDDPKSRMMYEALWGCNDLIEAAKLGESAEARLYEQCEKTGSDFEVADEDGAIALYIDGRHYDGWADMHDASEFLSGVQFGWENPKKKYSWTTTK